MELRSNFKHHVIILIIHLGIMVERSHETLLKFKQQNEQPLIGLAVDEQREPPLFYDTFFPVVYEMEVPSWKSKDLRLELPQNLTNASQLFLCNDTYNSTDLWANTLCPITLKLSDLLDGFASQMKVFETFNASETKLDSQFSSCHEVKPHFSNHIIDEIEIELYLIQVILDCPMADVIHQRIPISHPNKTKYTEILKMFIETHISPRFRIVGYSKYAISTNVLLALHTTELLDYLLDTFSWTTSINTCNSQRIPRLLVSQATLRKTLGEVQTKVEKKGLKLAIPISDISNYYKLQLADCVMTTSKSYIIRVLIPLVKTATTYKLIKINPIPFLNKDNKSTKIMICQHHTLEGTLIVEGTSMKPVARVKCEEAELCRVPPEGDRPVFSKCHTAALLNDTKGMLESCRMQCLSYDAMYLPYIKRIRSDQFAIVGTSSADVFVSCKRETKPLAVTGVPKALGSMIITLPCSCYLAHRSDKYEINGPCDFQLEMKPVKPMGWSYDILLEHFHHKKHSSKNKGGSKLTDMNGSTFDIPDVDTDDEEDFNQVMLCGQQYSTFSIWPIVLAYVILLIGCVGLVAGFYILRNVYVRIGQLEVSTALTRRTVSLEPELNRNVPVAYNVRGSGYANNDSVY